MKHTVAAIVLRYRDEENVKFLSLRRSNYERELHCDAWANFISVRFALGD